MSDKKIDPQVHYERIIEGYVHAYLRKINDMARETLRLKKGKKK